MITEFPEAPVTNNQPDRSLKLENFAYLWRLDDTVWVAQRELDWNDYVKPVFKDHPKDEQKLLEDYFKRGKKNRYYPSLDWFFLTPYESKEDLLKLMNSSLVSGNEKRNLIEYYLLKDLYRFSECPWYRRHMTMFIDSYYSDTYTVIKEQEDIMSPGPTFWCKLVVNEVIDAINKKEEWIPLYQCVDYFVSILPFAFRPKARGRIKLHQLMDLVNQKLEERDLEGEILGFVKELKDKEQHIFEAWLVGEKKIKAGIKAPSER